MLNQLDVSYLYFLSIKKCWKFIQVVSEIPTVTNSILNRSFLIKSDV